MVATKTRLTLDPNKLNGLLRGRTGPVARVMAGFAGLSTRACRQVAQERINSRTGAYVRGIRSTTQGSPLGVKMVTEATAPHSRILERGSRPHLIVARRARVLRFEVSGATIFRPRVQHPGTRPYNILRDGVRRAARQLDRIAG